jgi:hypothetical protein
LVASDVVRASYGTVKSRELSREGEETGVLKGEISRMGARAGLSNKDSRRDFWGTARFGEARGDVGRVGGPMEASGDEWDFWARGRFRGSDEEEEGERREWDNGKRGARHRRRIGGVFEG